MVVSQTPSRHARPSLQLLYTRTSVLYTVLIPNSVPCTPYFLKERQMDWFYLLLIAAFYGVSVLLIYGIEKLRGKA